MVRYAQKNDLEQLRKLDQLLAPSELEQCIRDGRVLVLIRQELVGCLRYNLFWDNLPFYEPALPGRGRAWKGLWHSADPVLGGGDAPAAAPERNDLHPIGQAGTILLPEAWVCGLWGPAAAR